MPMYRYYCASSATGVIEGELHISVPQSRAAEIVMGPHVGLIHFREGERQIFHC